jgi:putative transposase
MIASPLTKLTRKESLWQKGGELPREAYLAFRELQSHLVSEPIVDYPRRDRSYALFTDASFGDERHDGGLGAILTQINENKDHCVIGYASRKLAVHEKNYTPFLLEMQAAIFGMEHFGTHLKGRHFTLFTDHKPLEKLGKVHTKTLNRLQEIMNVYDFEIVYI